MHNVLSGGARLRRAITAALIAAPLAFAGSASAADAPLRSIGIGLDGKRTWQIAWFSSNDDATQVVGTIRPNDDFTPGKEEGVVARDVVAGQTTLLVPAPATLVAASADLQRLIFMTSTSYSASDTNGLIDAYVLDRPTGTKTLLSADDDGQALGDNSYPDDFADLRQIANVAISAGGKVAQFTATEGLGDTARWRSWRVDLDTGTRTQLPVASGGMVAVVDDAARVLLRDGVLVDGKKIADLDNSWSDFTLSPNGRYLGYSRYQPDNLVIIDLQTGQKTEIPYPTYPNQAYTRVRRVADDGKSLLISDRIGTENGRRIVFGRVATDGTLTQLGGGVQHSTWGRNEGDRSGLEQGGITQDGSFAITGLSVAQLGTEPLPGAEPTAPRAETFADYVTVSDARCTTSAPAPISWFVNNWRAPQVTVADTPQRADVRQPVDFKGKVAWLLWGDAYSSLPIVKPGPTYSLRRLGYLGGWKLSGTVIFDDGSTISGSKTLPFHGLPACEFSLFG